MTIKKIFIMMSAVLFTLMLTSCWDDDKVITEEQLPEMAKSYIKTNYPTETVLFVKQDNELFSKKFKVQLSNGMEVEFNSDGEVTDVDMAD